MSDMAISDDVPRDPPPDAGDGDDAVKEPGKEDPIEIPEPANDNEIPQNDTIEIPEPANDNVPTIGDDAADHDSAEAPGTLDPTASDANKWDGGDLTKKFNEEARPPGTGELTPEHVPPETFINAPYEDLSNKPKGPQP
jgi:hypothetical protein